MPVRPYAVDTSAGSLDSTVSNQWFSRPADEKYADLNALFNAKKAAYDAAWETRVSTRGFCFEAPIPETKEDFKKLTVGVPNVRTAGADVSRTVEVAPTHWA